MCPTKYDSHKDIYWSNNMHAINIAVIIYGYGVIENKIMLKMNE